MKIPDLRLTSDENIIFAMRTHPKALVFRVLAGLVLLAIAIWYGVTVWSTMNEWVNFILMGILLIVGIFYSVWPILVWWNAKFIITNRQIIIISGILIKKTHSSQLSKVSDLSVERGILDRIFKCGTIIVLNATGQIYDVQDNSTRVTLHDVPNVLDVEEKIKDMVFNRVQ